MESHHSTNREQGLIPPGNPRKQLCWRAVATVAALVLLAALGLARKRSRAVTLPVVACLLSAFSLAALAAGQAAPETKAPPTIRKHFEPFKDRLQLRHDDDYLYVGSDAFPDHQMMVGIKAWQQQVPLPQPYTGKNAWRIPLKPVLAEKPISAKTALYRGAIALAVNGVPIFNALNNRGEDAYLAGELDEFGGHCGRGDDYHYHIAPVHLEKIAGKGKPIAYALDGFPLYGYTDADDKAPKDLDEFNGRMEKDGYRYYSTKKYPYINGGMRGVVTVRGDQIDPQPRDAPARPAQKPLRGAKITGFTRDDKTKTYKVEYDLRGKTHSVGYTINKDGSVSFVFTDGDGNVTKRTYRRDRRPPKSGMTWLGSGLLGVGLASILGGGILFVAGRSATKPKRSRAVALLVGGALVVACGGALLSFGWSEAP